MADPGRIRLVVLFGGQSAEHEVSCVSARHVLAAADPERYDIAPVGITRDGRWIASPDALALVAGGARALPSPDDAPSSAEIEPMPALDAAGSATTVVLPLLHGPMGEDGTVQGLCELAGVPYVGAGVAASAVCMDKALAKSVLDGAGIAQTPWFGIRDVDVDDDLATRIGAELGWPAFVKPANLGSSVGVSKVDGPDELAAALAEAFRFDEFVVLEQGVVGREIEVAVLGNADPKASLPGEIVPGNDFYDYEDKYVTDGADLRIPADLSDEEIAEVRRLAVAAYKALRVDGMARVDFFYEEGGRGWLVNELNTIPGFTPISMYPKMWEASGLPYADLVDELVRLAVERHERRSRFSREH